TRCLARQLIYNTTLSAKVNPFFQFFSTYFFPPRIWGPVLWRGTGCGAWSAKNQLHFRFPYNSIEA
ncbi:hypothetical protein MSS88_02605, partial [bacterium]|nr:hypothetical protein [bacterium]